MVAGMFLLGWEEGGEAWQWCRRLQTSEDELLGECRILLSDISLQQNSIDRWVWRLDPSNCYTVSGVYHLLTRQLVRTIEAASDLIWRKQVPLKVCVLAWRLLRNRLPTKDNLLARGVLSHINHHCVAVGCSDFETVQHLFISCPFLQLFGAIFGSTLVYFMLGQTIFISLFTQQVERAPAVLLCNSFGYVVCGLCGMKGIRGYLKTMRSPSINWWRKSNYIPFGG